MGTVESVDANSDPRVWIETGKTYTVTPVILGSILDPCPLKDVRRPRKDKQRYDPLPPRPMAEYERTKLCDSYSESNTDLSENPVKFKSRHSKPSKSLKRKFCEIDGMCPRAKRERLLVAI